MSQNSSSLQSSSELRTGNGKWHAPQSYEEMIEAAGRALEKTNRRATILARQYPVQVAAGALCVGILIGATLFRRRA